MVIRFPRNFWCSDAKLHHIEQSLRPQCVVSCKPAFQIEDFVTLSIIDSGWLYNIYNIILYNILSIGIWINDWICTVNCGVGSKWLSSHCNCVLPARFQRPAFAQSPLLKKMLCITNGLIIPESIISVAFEQKHFTALTFNDTILCPLMFWMYTCCFL